VTSRDGFRDITGCRLRSLAWFRQLVARKYDSQALAQLNDDFANVRLDAPPASARAHPASLAARALRRQDPRQEPSAVAPFAGICAGGGPTPCAKGRPYRDRTW
jgi:hypothetical protein